MSDIQARACHLPPHRPHAIPHLPSRRPDLQAVTDGAKTGLMKKMFQRADAGGSVFEKMLGMRPFDLELQCAFSLIVKARIRITRPPCPPRPSPTFSNLPRPPPTFADLRCASPLSPRRSAPSTLSPRRPRSRRRGCSTSTSSSSTSAPTTRRRSSSARM